MTGFSLFVRVLLYLFITLFTFAAFKLGGFIIVVLILIFYEIYCIYNSFKF
jgi:hypothetical protein